MADLSVLGLTENDIKPAKKEAATADLSALGLTGDDLKPTDQPEPTAPKLQPKDIPPQALSDKRTEMMQRERTDEITNRIIGNASGETVGQIVDMAAAFNRGIVGLVDLPVTLFNITADAMGSDVRAAGLKDIPLVQEGTRGGMGPETAPAQALELGTEILSGGIGTAGAAKVGAKLLSGAPTGSRAQAMQRAAQEMGKIRMTQEISAAAGGSAASTAVNHSEILSDSALAQTLAPIVGGVAAASPVAMAKSAAKRMPGQNKMTRASEVVIAAADDPDVAVQELAKRNITNIGAVTQTGDVGVMTLARSLARENPIFEGQLNDQIVMAQRSIQGEVDNLFTPNGRPVSPTAAQDFIKSNSDELIRQLGDRANAALEKVQNLARLGRGKINDIELSRQAKVQLEKAMRDVANQRDVLWNQVGKEIPIETSTLKAEAAAIVKEARKASVLPIKELELILGKKISKTKTGYQVGKKSTSSGYGDMEPVGELMTMRSRLLAQLRAESKDAISTVQAPIFNRLQGAVIDTIDNAPLPAGVDENAYRVAARFTREMHEVFDQGLIGRVLTSNTKGGEAVLSEKTLLTLLGGGREAQAAGARELSAVADFAELSGGQQAAKSDLLNGAQEYIAAQFQRQVKDPESAANFMVENEEAIKYFPKLQQQLTEVMRAIGVQSGNIDRLKAGQAAIEKSAFTKIAGMNGKKAVNTILSQRNPGQFARQVRLLVGRDKDALRGMQRDIANTVIDASRVVSKAIPQLESQVSKEALVRIRNKYSPIIKAFYTPEMQGNLKLIQDEVAKLEGLTAQTPGRVEIPRSMVGDLLARASGAHLAAKLVSGSGAGPSLIAAKAGSEAGRQMVFAIPESATKAVLEAAMFDRELLTKLLRRGVAVSKESEKLAEAIHVVIRQNVGEKAAEEFRQNVQQLELNYGESKP